MTEKTIKQQAEEIAEGVEPVTNDTPAVEETPQPTARTTARPRKTSNTRARRSQAQRKKDTESLAQKIQGIHALIAITTGLQELNIGDKESEQLAGAFEAISEEYGFEIDGKTGAALQLFAAAAMVYTPRYFMIRGRLDKERKAREEEEQKTGGIIIDVPQYK